MEWSDRVQGVISTFFCLLLRFALCYNLWSVLEKDPWAAEKKVYSLVFG